MCYRQVGMIIVDRVKLRSIQGLWEIHTPPIHVHTNLMVSRNWSSDPGQFGHKTFWTEDTSNRGHFGTSVLVPKCPDTLAQEYEKY